jgi:hypothetical protein
MDGGHHIVACAYGPPTLLIDREPLSDDLPAEGTGPLGVIRSPVAGHVCEVDPTTNAVSEPIPLPGNVSGVLAVTADGVWFSGYDDEGLIHPVRFWEGRFDASIPPVGSIYTDLGARRDPPRYGLGEQGTDASYGPHPTRTSPPSAAASLMTDFGTSPVKSMMSKDFSRYRVRSTTATASHRPLGLLRLLVRSPGVEHALFLLARQSGGRVVRGFATPRPLERVHDRLLERPDPQPVRECPLN